MAVEDSICVEVVYALADRQTLISLSVPPGTTAAKAVNLSRIHEIHPELDLEKLRVGIYGRRVAADTVLQAGDRVEIYRSLIIDPSEARRRRAARPP